MHSIAFSVPSHAVSACLKDDLQIPANLRTTCSKRLFPRSPNDLWKATCPLCPRHRHSPADLSAPHALCAMGAGCIRATPAKRYFICIQGIDMHCTSLPSSCLPKQSLRTGDWVDMGCLLGVFAALVVYGRTVWFGISLAKTSKLPRYELQVDPPQVEVPSTPKAEFGPEVRRKIMENRVKLAVKAVQVFSFRSLCCSSCFLVFLEISSVFWGNTASIPELKESTNDKKNRRTVQW